MNQRRRSRGFTLLELGIVIGVITILATTVLVGRGFIVSARVGSAVQTIDTVRKGAREWVRRQAQDNFAGVTLALIQGEGILPTPFLDPWGNAPSLQPWAGNQNIRIGVCTESVEAGDDLVRSLVAGGLTTMGMTSRGACAGGSSVFVITR